MLLFLSIILAVVVAFLVVTAERMFSSTIIVDEEDSADFFSRAGAKAKSIFTCEDGWLKGLIIGGGVGLINYLTPKLTWGGPAIAFCFMLVMLALSGYLIYWWYQGGSNFKEVLVMSLLAFLVFLTTKSTAAMAVSLFKAKFWRLLIMALPTLALTFSIGFFIVNALFYNYKKSGFKKTMLRVLAWVVMILVTISALSTLAPCFFADNLGSGSQQITESEVSLWDRFVALFRPGTDSDSGDTGTGTGTGSKLSWYGFYNLALLRDDDSSNDFNFGWNCYDESWTAEDYDAEFRNRIKVDPALGAADMAWLDANVGTRFIGVFYDECNGAWDKAINTAKERFMAVNETKLYYPTLDAFFAYLDKAVKVEVKRGKGITDQMYMNPFTIDGIPDVIVMKTDNHQGWFLVYTFVIKPDGEITKDTKAGKKIEVAYRIECGFQPCNVKEIMHIDPEPQPQPTKTPKPPKPTKTPEPTNTPKPTKTPETPATPTPKPTNTPEPTDTPKPPATPTPAPTATPNPTKDPTVGTSPGPNDDDGPGPNTNTGEGGQYSSEDQPGNSDHMTYDEYHDAMDDLDGANDHQGGGNTPTVTPAPGTNVDSNADEGTGNGGVNDPTPTQEPVHIVLPETGETAPISTDPAGQWGGPPD